MIFPISKNEWYRLRDDRTNRVEGIFEIREYSVSIIAGSEICNSYQKQIMLSVLVNICSRWCRNISITIPDNIISLLDPHKDRDFRGHLTSIAKSADPYLALSFDGSKKDKIANVLAIGVLSSLSDKNVVWIDCDDWIAGIGFGNFQKPLSFKKESSNFFGAVFAACLGAAQLFRNAVMRKKPLPFCKWYSLFDFQSSNLCGKSLKNPELPTNINLGNIFQLGCGAVGSSFSYLLSLTDWQANIVLIDHDKVEFSNCNRSLIFSAADACNELFKVDCCKKKFSGTKIIPHTHRGLYSSYIKDGKYLNIPPDTILCLANEENIWSDIQENYPPLVYHSTTTKNWGINLGRHIPKKEWCILCRFSKELQRTFVPPCSEGKIKISETNQAIEGVLPFLSPLAALFLLVELAKIQFDGYPVNKNFITFSTKTTGNDIFQENKFPAPECGCSDLSLDFYLDEIKNSKYWPLTL